MAREQYGARAGSCGVCLRICRRYSVRKANPRAQSAALHLPNLEWHLRTRTAPSSEMDSQTRFRERTWTYTVMAPMVLAEKPWRRLCRGCGRKWCGWSFGLRILASGAAGRTQERRRRCTVWKSSIRWIGFAGFESTLDRRWARSRGDAPRQQTLIFDRLNVGVMHAFGLVPVNAPSSGTGLVRLTGHAGCNATCAQSIVQRQTAALEIECADAIGQSSEKLPGAAAISASMGAVKASTPADLPVSPVAVPDFRLLSVEPRTLAGPEGSPTCARSGAGENNALARRLYAPRTEAERLAGPDPPPPIPPLRAAACRVICASLGHATDRRPSALPGVDTDETCKAQRRCSDTTQRGRVRRGQSDLLLPPLPPTPSQYSQYSSFPGLSLALPCLWSLPPFPMADTDGPACAPAVSWSPISSLSQVRNQPSGIQPLEARGFDYCEASSPIYAAQVTVSDRHPRIARHRQYIAKLLPIKCPPRPLYIRLSGTPLSGVGLRNTSFHSRTEGTP